MSVPRPGTPPSVGDSRSAGALVAGISDCTPGAAPGRQVSRRPTPGPSKARQRPARCRVMSGGLACGRARNSRPRGGRAPAVSRWSARSPACAPALRRFPDGSPRRGVRSVMRKRQSPAVMPTPGQWAQEKLKHAPARSEEWARGVARIYCLEISDDQEGAVTPEDRETIQRTGARDSRASRAAAGLPEHIEDPAAAAQLAGPMRGTSRHGAQRPAKPRTGTVE